MFGNARLSTPFKVSPDDDNSGGGAKRNWRLEFYLFLWVSETAEYLVVAGHVNVKNLKKFLMLNMTL